MNLPSISMLNSSNESSVSSRWAHCLTAAAASCMLLSGCARHDLQARQESHPNPFNDEFAQWGETHRPPGQPGNLTGASEESRQVERNLGIR
jgi:hypothetical protein